MPRPVREVVRDPLRNGAPLCTGYWPDGNPCRRIAVTGKTKCTRHGGHALSGAANPNYKTGRYSKDLPMQLARRAEAARNNPEQLSSRDDLAVVEARLAELYAGLPHGESGALWQELRTAFEAFRAATQASDDAAMRAAFRTLDHLITVGGAPARAWKEIRELLLTQDKLRATEVKTLQGLQQLVTVQQMELHLGAVTGVVVEACERFLGEKDKRRVLQYVLKEFTHLATLEGPRPLRDVTPAPTQDEEEGGG